MRNKRSAFWGCGRASWSSDAACSHNLEAEAAVAVGKHDMSALVDMYKCYECIIVSTLVEEARH
eukprot:2218474-Pyramimonas_sp.AAC.1